MGATPSLRWRPGSRGVIPDGLSRTIGTFRRLRSKEDLEEQVGLLGA